MPLQNRVTPYGKIIAVSDRGNFMGNRGQLHDQNRKLVRLVTSYKRCVICQLSFKARKRQLMTPQRYTEQFFLDEATALAAGHRPCFECRRAAFHKFVECWSDGNPEVVLPTKKRTDDIDRVLHGERHAANLDKPFAVSKVSKLPDGSFCTVDSDEEAHPIWKGRLHRWTPGGYADAMIADPDRTVQVITPRSIVNAIRTGYIPAPHPTIGF